MQHRTLVRFAPLLLLLTACPRTPSTTPLRTSDAGVVMRDVPHADAAAPAVADPTAPQDRLVPFGSRDGVRALLRERAARTGRSLARERDGVVSAVATPQAAAAPMGGGGTGEGAVGLGSIGTLGHGAGTGTGSGYGSGAGRGLGQGARVDDNVNGVVDPQRGESITNNQVQGIEEGDIVKMHGDQLVLLRRGRLFTIRLGDAGLTTLSAVNAWGRGRPHGDWYDEMLVDGDTVLVIGYSYRAQATEVGLFDIDANGAIAWRDTMYVRSSDYYSARNYASRLVGHRLVMYMPIPLRDDERGLTLPAVRHTHDGAWESVVNFDRLYRPVQALGWQPTVHTVMTCDLANRGFACTAAGVVGPEDRNMYVSGSAVYLWVGGQREPWAREDAIAGESAPPPAVLYRVPLDGSMMGAVRARGTPIDQFSFDERGDTMRVVVRAEGRGEGMWGSEQGSTAAGLLRVPMARFRDTLSTMEGAAYRGLPSVGGNAYSMQNRFVGDHLLLGAGDGWYDRGAARNENTHALVVFDVAHNTATQLTIPHSVERLEPLGRDALAVGNARGGLTFSSIALDATPTVVGQHTVAGASQGETRSHGFFFAPEGDRRGVLGLPITNGDDGGAWNQLRNVSSAVVFLRVNDLRFAEAGRLRGRAASLDDHCVASCSDWYGNARPIFWRGRTFALLGYELVEGSLAGGAIRETRRIDVARMTPVASANPFDNITD